MCIERIMEGPISAEPVRRELSSYPKKKQWQNYFKEPHRTCLGHFAEGSFYFLVVSISRKIVPISNGASLLQTGTSGGAIFFRFSWSKAVKFAQCYVCLLLQQTWLIFIVHNQSWYLVWYKPSIDKIHHRQRILVGQSALIFGPNRKECWIAVASARKGG